MHPLAAGFAQVLGKSGGTVGCGYLLHSGAICTCAHVCAQALGDANIKLSATPPSEPISLAFPFTSSETWVANITSWTADVPGGADAAMLTVLGTLPAALQPLPTVSANYLAGAPFEVHGFQSGTAFSVNAQGRFGDRNPRGWFELIGDSVHGFFVQPGFSGGAVWSPAHQACVGMIKAVATDASLRVAFLLPDELLSKRLPGYDRSKGQLPPFDIGRHRLFVAASRRYRADRDFIAQSLADLLQETDDPTQRYWIYETLGDIGGDVARGTILRSLSEELDPFAKSGVENAARSFTQGGIN
jgi:hypothetical protein